GCHDGAVESLVPCDLYLSLLLSMSPEAHPAHHRAAGAHAGQFLHYFAGLLELLQETIDILNARSTSGRNPRAPLAVENQMILALLDGHRIDDGLDAHQLALRFLGIDLSRDLLQPWNH